MSPCWWLIIQIFSMILLLLVYVEIYYSFNFNSTYSLKESLSGPVVSNSVNKVSISPFLNE